MRDSRSHPAPASRPNRPIHLDVEWCGPAFCFSDEAGFAYWAIAAASVLVTAGPGQRRHDLSIICSIPFIFFVITRFVVPLIYGSLGSIGSFDATASAAMAWHLIERLWSPVYWRIALDDLGRGASLSLGLSTLPPLIVALPLAGVAAVSLALWRLKREERWYRVFWASSALLCTSGFLSLIDGVDSLDKPNYLGRLTYYYHSPVAVLSVALLAMVYAATKHHFSNSLKLALFTCLVVAAGWNLRMFNSINQVIGIMHLYPLESRQLKADILTASNSSTHDAPLHLANAKLTCRFTAALSDLRPEEVSAFSASLDYYRQHPMGDTSYAERLAKAFFPSRHIRFTSAMEQKEGKCP